MSAPDPPSSIKRLKVSAFAVPFNNAYKIGMDLNLPITVLNITGVLVDDEAVGETGADAVATTVAAGTSGHYLKSQGAGSVPVFAELAISSDASPQLGANLDLLAFNITSSSTIMNPSISSTGKALVLGF